MAAILFMFIIFPYHWAVYMYKIVILQKPLSHLPPNFTLILLLKCNWEFVQMITLHWLSYIFFFKIKNCLNGDLFITCDDRIGKMLHNICLSAVAMSLRWATRGPWASCFLLLVFFFQFAWNMVWHVEQIVSPMLWKKSNKNFNMLPA